MKQLLAAAAALWICGLSFVFAQGRDGTMNITVTIGAVEYAAQFDSNDAALEVASFFPLALDMKEWAANKEYYAGLGKTITGKAPAADKIAAGDVMLYSGRSLVIFYGGSANTSGYVRLGCILDAKNLKAALDKAGGKVSFARAKEGKETSAVSAVPVVKTKETGAALTKEQKEVYSSYEEICRAMVAKDKASMERYFDKDLTFTHMSGKKQTRCEYIGEIMDGTLNYYKITTKEYNIRVNGDTAYMSVTHTLDAKVYGMTGAWTTRGTATYKKRGGIWVRVNESVPEGVF
ncbi:DUF4440 domain-containing protein [Treponema parvum]|uniref:DUF4440 domain-containing protein n=1 Tax=Treponema parvum TaxID=138851 RepID=A0A975EXR8_9SPIR|nr:cyclophilin-like fold protein [Treponema parvum]QTQ10818.1 DUF4440 domain-containing protein [Treponema parvum]QTQ17226.1 DUF4440 domain-containing protein [Treponema parvum]